MEIEICGCLTQKQGKDHNIGIVPIPSAAEDGQHWMPVLATKG